MPANELVVVHECDPEPSDLHLDQTGCFHGCPGVWRVFISDCKWARKGNSAGYAAQLVRRGGREHLASMPQPVIVARYASKYGGRVGKELVCLWISSWRE